LRRIKPLRQVWRASARRIALPFEVLRLSELAEGVDDDRWRPIKLETVRRLSAARPRS
jgi:hypothetical protein